MKPALFLDKLESDLYSKYYDAVVDSKQVYITWSRHLEQFAWMRPDLQFILEYANADFGLFDFW